MKARVTSVIFQMCSVKLDVIDVMLFIYLFIYF